MSAVTISDLIATIALLVSAWVHFSTKWALKRYEKPLTSLIKKEIRIRNHRHEFKLTFKNIGKHPLNDLHIRYGFAVSTKPENLIKFLDVTVANRIDPEGTFSLMFNGNFVLIRDKPQIVIFVKCAYTDEYEPNKKVPPDKFWLNYEPGSNDITLSRNDDKKIIESYVTEFYDE